MEETMIEEIQGKINAPNNLTALSIGMTAVDVMKTQFFSYKGQDYKVIKMVRTRVGAHWFDGVEYGALYEVGLNEWSGPFVRTLDDFISKFYPTPKEG